MFMHTIDGRPAGFDGEQVVFATHHPHWQDRPYPVRLVASLRTIRAQQERSRSYRASAGFFDEWDYGYAYVEVP